MAHGQNQGHNVIEAFLARLVQRRVESCWSAQVEAHITASRTAIEDTMNLSN
jgi:hypothetical protein